LGRLGLNNMPPKTKNAPKVQKQLAQLANEFNQMMNSKRAAQSRRAKKPRKKNNKNKGPMGLSMNTTVEKVQRSLTNPYQGIKRQGSGYLACRLNPFSSHGAKGILDGGNSDYIMIDHLSLDYITGVDGKAFIIQTLPMLPIPAMINSTARNVTGVLNINGNSYTSSNDYNSSWYPLGIPPEYYAINSFPGAVTNDPYNSVKARIVSIGYKLIYTGPTFNCAGTFTVTPNNIGCTSGFVSTTNLTLAPPNSILYRSYACDQLSSTPSSIGTSGLNVDFTTNPNVFVKDSVINRQELGCYILMKHASSDFKLMPTADSPRHLAGNNSMTSTVGGNYVNNLICSPTLLSTAEQGNFFYDDDWSGVQIVVAGHTAGATYTLETAVCMEYQVSQTSPFATLTEKSSPINMKELAKANAIVNSLPVSSTGRPR
jgi:hypothetical protein